MFGDDQHEADKRPGLSPEDVELVARHAPDAIVVLDGTGLIVWANDAAHRLFATPAVPIEGVNAFDRIHPDDHAQALTALVAAHTAVDQDLPGSVLIPANYRLLVGEEYRWFEVAGVPYPAPEIDRGTIAVLRDVGRHHHLTRAIELIAASAPLTQIIDELLQGVDHQEPTRYAGASWIEGGTRRVASIAMPPELVWSEHADDPWCRTVAEGVSHGLTSDELRPELRALAARHGLTTVATVPVADPASAEPGCLVLWAGHDAVLASLQVRAHREASSLFQLALNQRHERNKLVHAATHDALTDLLNRRALLEALQELELRGTPVSLLFCDLDEFKPVNDLAGHEMGDRVLGIIAERLAGAVRDGDLVGRLGGDEFAVAVVGLADPDQIVAIAERVLSAVGQPIRIESAEGTTKARVDISIGIAIPEPAAAVSADMLLNAADDAMYAAKRSGRGRWHLTQVSTIAED